MDTIVSNYAYKVSAFMSGGMFFKVCFQGHAPSWYVNEDQQANAWKLFGWAHMYVHDAICQSVSALYDGQDHWHHCICVLYDVV